MQGSPQRHCSGVAAGPLDQQAHECGQPRAAGVRWHAIYLAEQQYGSLSGVQEAVRKTTRRRVTHPLLRKQSIRLAQHQVLDCTAAQQYETVLSLGPLALRNHTFKASTDHRSVVGRVRGDLACCALGCPLLLKVLPKGTPSIGPLHPLRAASIRDARSWTLSLSRAQKLHNARHDLLQQAQQSNITVKNL